MLTPARLSKSPWFMFGWLKCAATSTVIGQCLLNVLICNRFHIFKLAIRIIDFWHLLRLGLLDQTIRWFRRFLGFLGASG